MLQRAVRQVRAGWGREGCIEAAQGRAGQIRIGYGAVWDRAGQGRAGQSRTGYGAVWDRAGQGKTEQSRKTITPCIHSASRQGRHKGHLQSVDGVRIADIMLYQAGFLCWNSP